jgi:hypothetical protein
MQSCRWTWSEALQELFQVSCWMRLCDKAMHVVMSWLEPYSWSYYGGIFKTRGNSIGFEPLHIHVQGADFKWFWQR